MNDVSPLSNYDVISDVDLVLTKNMLHIYYFFVTFFYFTAD